MRWVPGRVEIIELRGALAWKDQAGVWVMGTYDLGPGGAGFGGGVQVGSRWGLVTYGVTIGVLVCYFLLLANSSD